MAVRAFSEPRSPLNGVQGAPRGPQVAMNGVQRAAVCAPGSFHLDHRCGFTARRPPSGAARPARVDRVHRSPPRPRGRGALIGPANDPIGPALIGPANDPIGPALIGPANDPIGPALIGPANDPIGPARWTGFTLGARRTGPRPDWPG